MYPVEIYGRVRRAVLVEGRSQRSVAREFGLARVTVRKMVGYSIPPGYRRKEPAKRPKLRRGMGVIDAILEEDKTQPAKQRHTAKRIFDRLRAEHAFPGGYTIVKDYVRAAAQGIEVPMGGFGSGRSSDKRSTLDYIQLDVRRLWRPRALHSE